MKRTVRLSAMVAVALVASAEADAPKFVVTSPDFGGQGPIAESHVFNRYGCTGANRSPALEWRGAPDGTKSFAITMFDLDEHGSPSGWWHWVVYNVPAKVNRLAEGAGAVDGRGLPAGAVQGRTDMSEDGYHGPCPDKGQPPHRYQITVYALSVDKLSVPAEASGAMVTYTVQEYVLAKATFTGLYGR